MIHSIAIPTTRNRHGSHFETAPIAPWVLSKSQNTSWSAASSGAVRQRALSVGSLKNAHRLSRSGKPLRLPVCGSSSEARHTGSIRLSTCHWRDDGAAQRASLRTATRFGHIHSIGWRLFCFQNTHADQVTRQIEIIQGVCILLDRLDIREFLNSEDWPLLRRPA